jgi:hypothetical protein
VQWDNFFFLEDKAFLVAYINYAVLIYAAMFVILELEQHIVCKLVVL